MPFELPQAFMGSSIRLLHRHQPKIVKTTSSLLSSSTTTTTSPPLPKPTSSVAIGTAYEHFIADYLTRSPSFKLKSIIRIGGSNDRGIDLRAFHHPIASKRFPVLVQCKAFSVPLQPSIIREFEGVLNKEGRPGDTLGILCGLNGFSKLSLKRIQESRFPLCWINGGVPTCDENSGGFEQEGIVYGLNARWRDLVLPAEAHSGSDHLVRRKFT